MTKDEVAAMIAKAERQRDKALVAILYLTGQRISEVIKLTRGDILVNPERPDILIFNFLVQKRRQRGPLIPRHRIPISQSAPFMGEFLEWIKPMRNPSARIFPMCRQHAWEVIKRLNPNTYPHFFRHTRLTHLADMGATGPELMTWAGWSDMRPAGRYLGRSEKRIEKYANSA